MTALEQAAEQIDEYYDEMLFDGMPSDVAIQVESARAQAHQDLLEETIKRALAMPMQLEWL